MSDNKFLLKLSQNLLESLEDNEYYDVTIEVGKDPHVKIFRAHMIVLHYRSPYLRRVLSTNKKRNDGTLTKDGRRNCFQVFRNPNCRNRNPNLLPNSEMVAEFRNLLPNSEITNYY